VPNETIYDLWDGLVGIVLVQVNSNYSLLYKNSNYISKIYGLIQKLMIFTIARMQWYGHGTKLTKYHCTLYMQHISHLMPNQQIQKYLYQHPYIVLQESVLHNIVPECYLCVT
jgi:hypothetical protein